MNKFIEIVYNMLIMLVLGLCLQVESNEWMSILKNFRPDVSISFELEKEEVSIRVN